MVAAYGSEVILVEYDASFELLKLLLVSLVLVGKFDELLVRCHFGTRVHFEHAKREVVAEQGLKRLGKLRINVSLVNVLLSLRPTSRKQTANNNNNNAPS